MLYLSAALLCFVLAVYFYIAKPLSLGDKLGIKENRPAVKFEPSFLGKMNYFIKLAAHADEKGAQVSPAHIGSVSLAASAAVFMAGLMLLQSVLFAVVFGVITFAAGSRLYTDYLIRKQRDKLTHQMPGAIFALVAALRAGRTLVESLKSVADDTPAPLGTEFAKAYAATKHGGEDLESALRKMLARSGNHHVVQRVTLAIIVSRQSGGDIASAIEEIGIMLDDENYTRDFTKSHSAQGRMIAVAFNIVMVVVAFNMNRYLDGAFTEFFLSDLTGRLMLSACIGVIILGWVLIQRVLASVHNV